jgi:hypothetical protein
MATDRLTKKEIKDAREFELRINPGDRDAKADLDFLLRHRDTLFNSLNDLRARR